MNKQHISNILKKFGLYKPIRKIYNYTGRCNKKTEIILNGKKIKFWTPTFYLDDYVKNLAGEELLLNKLLLKINDKNTFWDIGANIGFYSIIISKNMKINAKVYAFEPEPQTFKLLEKNILLNESENIIALPFALSNREGEQIIYPSDTPNFGAHSFIKRTDYKVKKKGKYVKMNSADNLIAKEKLIAPDILKIDVEGAETLVLLGMKNLLQNPKLKIIICEVHTNLLPLLNSSEEQIKEIIQKENFRIDFSLNRENQNQYIFIR